MNGESCGLEPGTEERFRRLAEWTRVRFPMAGEPVYAWSGQVLAPNDGLDNPWAALYNPSRITLRAAPEFTREALNFVAQYKDLVTPGEIDAPEQLRPGDAP